MFHFAVHGTELHLLMIAECIVIPTVLVLAFLMYREQFRR